MAVSEIAVVRQFSRKANSTTATTIAASTITFCTLPIDVSMKFACRKMIWSALMPSGRLALRSGDARPRARRVSATVSTFGCFSTETTTAGLPM